MSKKNPRWNIRTINGLWFVCDTKSKHPSSPTLDPSRCNLKDSETFLQCLKLCIELNVKEKRRRNRDHMKWDLVYHRFLHAVSRTEKRIEMKKRWASRKKRFNEFLRFALFKQL